MQLCREHGIGSHFSNIIGFPHDSEASIHEHLDILQKLSPNWASFYILCPIPGTEQYDEFLRQGWITEKNLDRFDTTRLTWKHPNLTAPQLSELLYECYRKFETVGHAFLNVRRVASQHGRGDLMEKFGSLSMSAFIRYCAWRRTHPMSGGILRVRLDAVSDYIELRRRIFGFEHAPLPESLKLTAHASLPKNSNRVIPIVGQSPSTTVR